MDKLYIKNLTTGEHRAYGTDQHDSLVSLDGGKTLHYYNLQNGDGSLAGYRFCDEKGRMLCMDDNGGEYANIGGFVEDTIPKKVKIYESHPEPIVMCPSCGSTFAIRGGVIMNYCGNCGQKLEGE